MNRMLNGVLAVVLLLTLAVLLLVRDAREVLAQPLVISHKIPYEITLGSNLKTIVTELQASGVIRNVRLPYYLAGYARIRGLAGSLKAGEYELAPGMSALDLLQLFVSGKILLHELKLIEGWTFEQALAAVAADEALVHTLDTADIPGVMTALGHPGLHPEGRFFPDTYHFPKGTTDVAFFKRAFAAMENALKLEWDEKNPGLPFTTPDEALIMASIIEKETGVAAERALVASVFINRLRVGMKLQTDPTVIYGLGNRFDGNLRRADLNGDTPYNSYLHAGLPPTPICLPGRASLHAALHPASSAFLFFVSRGNGSHVFSETLGAHNSAVNQFQKKTHARKK